MLARLSIEDTALFICDVQGCFVNTIYGFDDLVDAVASLLKGARILNLPCVITEQYPERLQHTCMFFFLVYLIVDSLQQYIQQTEDQKAYPVFSKVDFTMCTEEVCTYMNESLSQVKNVILCGMEVTLKVLDNG